jgi:hypothetical protein
MCVTNLDRPGDRTGHNRHTRRRRVSGLPTGAVLAILVLLTGCDSAPIHAAVGGSASSETSFDYEIKASIVDQHGTGLGRALVQLVLLHRYGVIAAHDDYTYDNGLLDATIISFSFTSLSEGCGTAGAHAPVPTAADVSIYSGTQVHRFTVEIAPEMLTEHPPGRCEVDLGTITVPVEGTVQRVHRGNRPP